ncbi:hypothetical protein [Fibrobacter sp.]|uniref:hypothetical protein n=1 Tax=Fibrobacter sp. TaxID=35828 RepID=UPI00388DC77E
MLQIAIPLGAEMWDAAKEEFVQPETKLLQLEHSLVSLSVWESKWCKPFLTKDKKTPEEFLDYVKCMTLTPNVDPGLYDKLTPENVNEINKYIEAPMTATTISKHGPGGNSGEIVTSEVIYYWMVTLGIPSKYETWHLNRLMTLIQVCNIKNQPTKRMSQRDIASRYAALNAARRQRLNSRG